MQRKYNPVYFIVPSAFLLGLTTLMMGVDAQAQIAFVSNREGNFEIYVMDTDGKNHRRLTDNPAIDWDPSWSPDGERIVFSSEKGDSGWDIDIYVIDADGGNPRRLTRSPAENRTPSWPPDGEHIAFASNGNGNNDIYVMDANGKIPQNLTGKFFEQDVTPAWFRPSLVVTPAGRTLTMWGWLKQVVR